ncbi:hypothetical protein NMY3_02345 [Candidatus Nitrosocosmicus oleophilus]|uniref:Uncharacterized protein n=1 Tax=Candidatus Nitrosocosmicus oleophilus TaxID=1353260 RepID=A0A654M1W1_9ARCH|nr:hypothetical protein [Candidatus Nitrosocosmicus oleophilus]ALI36541.1 hypothetical protein NMY3_02345 [Candidatus Nitrosocosmicus oleophilus]
MNDIDPLALVKQYLLDKKIDERTYELIIDKMRVVEEGIKRIERKTSIDYPNYFIEPNLLVATSDIEYQQYSILYARTIPFCTTENRIKIVIQLSAPLVMYGLKGTLHAVLAHEFLHYLNILKNIINLEVTSDNISDTLYENSFSDNERTLDLTKVFRRDIYLQNVVNKKFVNGFNDSNLDKKAESFWIKKKLPIQKIMIGDNFIKLPFSALANTVVDDSLKNEISKFV